MILKLSRRGFLVGSAGVAATLAVHDARSQPATQTAPDGFRVLRAATAPSGTGAWSYDGLVPGPLLRARQGEEVRIRLNSELPEATAIHWHGVRIPSAMGGLQTLTQPLMGRTAATEYRFTAAHAGTYCYHAPYTMPGQIGRGLYGVFIVDEKAPVPVDQDLVVVIGDTPAAGPNHRNQEQRTAAFPSRQRVGRQASVTPLRPPCGARHGDRRTAGRTVPRA